MDWARAIERNSDALRGIVAGLFVMLGLRGGGKAARIPRRLHSAVLFLLRPAESALRRLIVIAARGIVVALAAKRTMPHGLSGKGRGQRHRCFRLFDHRKRFALLSPRTNTLLSPRIHSFAADPRVPAFRPQPAPALPTDGLVDAAPLGLRLEALKRALDRLPREARRLARWRARRAQAKNPKFTSPLRPGPPPGHRRIPLHPVDHLLAECHGLAWDALKPDTS